MSNNSRDIGRRILNHSTDSYCEIMEPLKLRSGHSKDKQEISDSLYEIDTILEGSSCRGTQRNSKVKRDGNGTNMKRDGNIKRKVKPTCRGNTCGCNKMGTCGVQNPKPNRKKCIKGKENSAKRFSHSNHANEILPGSTKAQKIDTRRSIKAASNIFNEKCFSKEKNKSITGPRSEIIRITDDIKLIYSKFTSQMLQLEYKYFQDVTLQGDAEDIVFIYNYNCIIHKLKKELTKKQQDLTNYYSRWNKKCKYDRVASGVQYKRYNYSSSRRMQSEQSSESSSDSEIGPTAFYKKDCNRSTNSSKKSGLKNNRNTVIKEVFMYNEGGSSSETTDRFLSSSDKECRHISQRNKDACISLDNLPEINLILLPSKSSTAVCKTKRNSISNRETRVRNWVSTSEGQVQKVHNCPKAQQKRIIEYVSDGSSRSSIASTIEIYPLTDEDEYQKCMVNPCIDELINSTNTSLIGRANDARKEVLGLSDSVDCNIQSITQDLQAPSKCHSTSATETNAYPPADTNLEQLLDAAFPDTDSTNVTGCINKLHAEDCKFLDTNQNCCVKNEYSISTTQALQDPCNYSCASGTKI